MTADLDLEELANILDTLAGETDPVSIPVARDRAVGIARLLLRRVNELESAARDPSSSVRRAPGTSVTHASRRPTGTHPSESSPVATVVPLERNS